MILTASPWPQQNEYTPLHPSPLSTRSISACSRAFTNPIMTARWEAKKGLPFSKRLIKPNPIIQNRDAVKERRRDLFLRKVQDDRDDRRWASRGDQILQLDFISRQRRWEAAKAHQAPSLDVDLDDYVRDIPLSNGQEIAWSQTRQANSTETHMGPREVDMILEQEDRELDALISLMDETRNHEDSLLQHYGSDEEDYDTLFREYLTILDDGKSNAMAHSTHEADAMDTSHG
ncbi:hypothetical protein AOQ84DRAFT_304443 [Glonium stellatum]|uniref:Uncharacterized protein n=1 Tax=Glonium stellatum TaxID=574774 RepID=A0A8E2EPV5_9PEZI|nr:hypothetical protein AOQ84DRAFT_304443 [Glonium stellatum]